ncbi:putative metal-dependent dipeptidase [Alteromonas macleodii str. 'Balearic Sea AD45']|uniref:M24 family metallopeptidase n=1 Tax=Alteromonas macleodii TaxID=28108 RepID=UPI000286F88B|nr:Xaa-Pro peptidase family protein [Alteromonas macleodii]AFT96348.1 putative metal-dependent dipeptidase [Alteromonas macleodii str. 'Balearic Sea AD45']
MDKRHFLKLAGASFALSPVASIAAINQTNATDVNGLSGLSDITANAKPISVEERKARIEKAQSLMKAQDIAAILVEPGAEMDYFSGIQWWRSERLTALVIPQKGDMAVVTPFFEKPSVLESLAIGDDVRVWQEHESPFDVVTNILKSRGITSGNIGFESSVRYFVVTGVSRALPNIKIVPAEPITLGCRMYKTASELALMHKANEVTLRAYEFVFSNLKLGMSQQDVISLMNTAQQHLGGSGTWCLALFNDASAYPHGTNAAQTIKEGSVILLDSGCSVHGYQSDISRTLVFGKAPQKVQDVWHTVREGQNVAFAAAKIGEPAGKVDDAVRQYYASKGYSKDYALPGLSHRTGHGIGMEGHESVNFVRGENTPLRKGMCFSNEPGIYIPGEFGVRLEDCLYMTETGPAYFTEPPESLAKPLGKLLNLKDK